MSATFSMKITVRSSITPPTSSWSPPIRRSARHATRLSRPWKIRRNINEPLSVRHPRRPPVRIRNESPGRYSQSRDAFREASRRVYRNVYTGCVPESAGVHPRTYAVWYHHFDDQSGDHPGVLVRRGIQLAGPDRSGVERERHSDGGRLYRSTSVCQGDPCASVHDLFDLCDRAEIWI